jgi:hypothetical protein
VITEGRGVWGKLGMITEGVGCGHYLYPGTGLPGLNFKSWGSQYERSWGHINDI